MDTMTMSFHGLCSFVSRAGDVTEVFLLPGHGDHDATLAIPTHMINHVRTTWKPTSLSAHMEVKADGSRIARQICLWSLRGENLTIDGGGFAGAPTWANPDDVFEFRVENPGSTTLSTTEILDNDNRVGIVTLQNVKGSSLTGYNISKYTVLKGTTSTLGQPFAQRIEWATPAGGLPLTLANRAGRQILLNVKSVHVEAFITCVAPVSRVEGLEHFHHYYDVIERAYGDDPVRIEQQIDDVYDCVPPTKE